MKQVELFKEFLSNTVDLNQTRIDLLDDNTESLKDFIRDSDWPPHIKGFEAQGSWAHRTIIKPIAGDEFDADLLVLVDHEDGWSAKHYIESLESEFKASELYKGKTKAWEYCITITYLHSDAVYATASSGLDCKNRCNS